MVSDRVLAAVNEDSAARRAAESLVAAGGEVYAVGGVVRDVALEVKPNDVDLMARNLTREQVRKALLSIGHGCVSEVGKSFGILEHRSSDGCVQVALPRKDRSIGVHHRDVDVQVDPWMSVEDDLRRRDYTINAVAVRWPGGEVVDPLNGLQDAKRGVVRAVSMDVLADDPLRVVRGIVLVARRQLVMDGMTQRMLRESAETVRNLPADRVHDELDKLMSSMDPCRGIRLALELGVLDVILPEVASMHGYDQKSKYHKLTLLSHTLAALSVAAYLTQDRDVRLAVLLHDVGKPSSAWVDDDGYQHYYHEREKNVGADHELIGADMAHDLMTRLRYSTTRVNRVASLVRHHMFAPFDSKKGARRFLARVGDLADDLLVVRQADDEGKQKETNDLMRRLVREVRTEESAFSLRDLVISGHDLIELGVPAGPERGRILRALLDEVVDDPNLNQRDYLLARVRSLCDLTKCATLRQGVPS